VAPFPAPHDRRALEAVLEAVGDIDTAPAAGFEAARQLGTRKPSVHTMKAYRQDFAAIKTLIVGADTGGLSRMSLGDITTDSMRTAFAQYATTRASCLLCRRSLRRSWAGGGAASQTKTKAPLVFRSRRLLFVG
jgi:hypothetical protein